MVSRYATCGLPTLASTLNSRSMRSTSTSRCSSPMPAMIVWPVSSSVWTVKVGSSSESENRALPILSWSALVFGSTATWMTGSGNTICSRTIGCPVVGQRVAGAGVLEADAGHDVAGAGDVEVLAVVGVHQQDAADPLLLAGAGVQDGVALLDLARVDPEVGEAAVGVGDDLEGEGGERLADVGLALELLLALRVHAAWSAAGRAATACSRRRRRAGAARPCS